MPANMKEEYGNGGSSTKSKSKKTKKTTKAGFLGPLNPFRKKVKVKNEDGSTTVTTYNRFSGKKVKDKTTDAEGNTTKTKYKGKDGQISKIKSKDSKIKYDKKTGNIRKTKETIRDDDGKRTGTRKRKYDEDGTIRKAKNTKGIFKRSEKVKLKDGTVRKSKNIKVTTDASGKITGSESAPGYKYKVKKKGDGIQVKEKGVMVDSPFGGKKKGTKKTRYDADGKQTSVKTRIGGIHSAQTTEGDGSQFIPKSMTGIPSATTDTKNVDDSTTKDTDTKKDDTTQNTDTKKETKPNYDDMSFSDAYRAARNKATQSGVTDHYGDKKGHFTWKGKSYNTETREEKKTRMKNVKSSWGGERRLGGAITGGAGMGGSQGPQGIL